MNWTYYARYLRKETISNSYNTCLKLLKTIYIYLLTLVNRLYILLIIKILPICIENDKKKQMAYCKWSRFSNLKQKTKKIRLISLVVVSIYNRKNSYCLLSTNKYKVFVDVLADKRVELKTQYFIHCPKQNIQSIRTVNKIRS